MPRGLSVCIDLEPRIIEKIVKETVIKEVRVPYEVRVEVPVEVKVKVPVYITVSMYTVRHDCR